MPSGSLHSITVISKDGCHLCERVIETLESLRSSHPFELNVLKIEDDQSLFERYWMKIPVVRKDGKDVFEAKDLSLSEEECRKDLGRLVSI